MTLEGGAVYSLEAARVANGNTTATAARREKAFPVSWDQFHRDARALAWHLYKAGPFEAIVCVTRGGLVPAAIVARELSVRIIETVCVSSYQDYKVDCVAKLFAAVRTRNNRIRLIGVLNQ